MKKNEEIAATLKKTEEQREKRREMECLQEEVDKRDEDIKQLQRQLKEAQHILVSLGSDWHSRVEPHQIMPKIYTQRSTSESIWSDYTTQMAIWLLQAYRYSVMTYFP